MECEYTNQKEPRDEVNMFTVHAMCEMECEYTNNQKEPRNEVNMFTVHACNV